MRQKILILTVILSVARCLFAQTDTISVTADTLGGSDTAHVSFFSDMWPHDPHSPGRAALYSAVLPGLGQAYNGKYWKIPLVYAALGTSGYFIYYWDSFYIELRDAYIARTDLDSLTTDTQYAYITSDATLLQFVDQTKRYTDLLVIVTGAIYVLNIIDAVVDAHLYDFNVADDLSLHVEPYLIPKSNMFTVPSMQFSSVGINLKLSWR